MEFGPTNLKKPVDVTESQNSHWKTNHETLGTKGSRTQKWSKCTIVGLEQGGQIVEEGRRRLETLEEEASRRRRSHALPCAGVWETGQIFIYACIAHAHTFSATELDGSTRWWPAVTSMGAVTPHSPSIWVFQKNTFTTLFLLREIPP